MTSFLDLRSIHSALSRAGYGPRPGETAAVAASGFPAWVEEQLAAERRDPDLDARLAATRLHIRYGADPNGAWPAVDEMRPLELLGKPVEDLLPRGRRSIKMDDAERRRPRDEVVAATLVRAVHARHQVAEVMAAFWHDHFNIDFFEKINLGAMTPVHDREAIRPHVLGNFRRMLEAVASSPPMVLYLSNYKSRAGGANENYARELLELHTLGRDAYLNDRPPGRRGVPVDGHGMPEGYVDQDVFEVARAFTGWGVEDWSAVDARNRLPLTGRFVYVHAWHDTGAKRVLATDIPPSDEPLAEGRRVLDLVAAHPATARHLAGKLVYRLVGDRPESLVSRVAEEWLKAVTAPDQIARAVRVILLSDEFMAAGGVRLRRPIALAAGFARAVQMDFVPSTGLADALTACGQRMFGWPTPDGLPDDDAFFAGTQGMLGRWNLLSGLAENRWGNGLPRLPEALSAVAEPSPRDVAAAWMEPLGLWGRPEVAEAVLAGLKRDAAPRTRAQIARIAALCAMAPAFQTA